MGYTINGTDHCHHYQVAMQNWRSDNEILIVGLYRLEVKENFIWSKTRIYEVETGWQKMYIASPFSCHADLAVTAFSKQPIIHNKFISTLDTL